MLKKNKIYTIGELSYHIKSVLEREDFTGIWVQGEISNFKRHSSGHIYFTMKDKNAVLRCVLFKENARNVRFSPTEGMKVIVKGDIRIYEQRGYYQLYVYAMKAGGIGELYSAFLKLKEKLQKEGLFDERFKKQIPKIPEKIGVITSSTGAAVQDIMNVLRRRYPVKVVFAPVHVQGLQASEDIIKAIEKLNEFEGIDVIILARGGGSLEDLWAFNEEKVARAIFSSRIPLISAIGHETDYTVADFVADRRAPTPSAAAEIAVPDKKELREALNAMKRQVMNAMNNKINFHRRIISELEKRRAMKLPLEMVERNREVLHELEKDLKKRALEYLERKEECVSTMSNILKTLSPISILHRGYTICMKIDEEKVIESVDMVALNEDMRVVFKDGAVKACVKERRKNGRFEV